MLDVDDIIYAARVGDLDELNEYLQSCVGEEILHVKDPESGNTPLHMACANGHISCIKALLNALPGPSLVNMANHAGNCALHWACLNGHVEVVKLLVEAGADPLLNNNAGYDCLYEAESNGKSDVVGWLLENVDYTLGDDDEDDEKK